MLAEVRHARRGGVLALPVLLLCAAGRTPTEIATVLSSGSQPTKRAF